MTAVRSHTFFAIATAIGLAVFLIARWIRHLSKTAEAFIQGDLSARPRIPNGPADPDVDHRAVLAQPFHLHVADRLDPGFLH